MATVFISYRRDDTTEVCGRIYDRLEDYFGTPNVFMDVDSIPAGTDFREALERMVERCDVLLAVIGPKWAGPLDAAGRRRIDLPADFVRTEIELAMKRTIPIIPVLVYGAQMPAPDTLPPSIAPLAYRHALTVRSDRDFRHDMERVIRGIEAFTVGKVAPAPVAPRPQPALPHKRPLLAAPEPPPERSAQAVSATGPGGALPRGSVSARGFEMMSQPWTTTSAGQSYGAVSQGSSGVVSAPQVTTLQDSASAIDGVPLLAFGGGTLIGLVLIMVSWFLPWFFHDNPLQVVLGTISGRLFQSLDELGGMNSVAFLIALILLATLGVAVGTGMIGMRAARRHGRLQELVYYSLILVSFGAFVLLYLIPPLLPFVSVGASVALGAVAGTGVVIGMRAARRSPIQRLVDYNLILVGFGIFALLYLILSWQPFVSGGGVIVALLGLLSLLAANIVAYRAIQRSAPFKTPFLWEAWTLRLCYPRIGAGAALSLAVSLAGIATAGLPVLGLFEPELFLGRDPRIFVLIALAIVAIPWVASIVAARRHNAMLWMLFLVCSGVAAGAELVLLFPPLIPFDLRGLVYFDLRGLVYSSSLVVYLPSLSAFLFGMVGPRQPMVLRRPV